MLILVFGSLSRRETLIKSFAIKKFNSCELFDSREAFLIDVKGSDSKFPNSLNHELFRVSEKLNQLVFACGSNPLTFFVSQVSTFKHLNFQVVFLSFSTPLA